MLTVRLLDSPGNYLITDADVLRCNMESRHNESRRLISAAYTCDHGTRYYQLVSPYQLTQGTSMAHKCQANASVRGSVQIPK